MGQKGVNETGDLLPRRVAEKKLRKKRRNRAAARQLIRKSKGGH